MPQPDLILAAGAGLCSELPDYQLVEPRQIVLIEPNPETSAELQAQAAGWDNVTVLQAAVTDRVGQASLRLFNFPELDSLREPTGLHSLLPGLRQVGWAEVSTLSAKALIEQVPLKADGHNWLVLEAPGEELIILAAMADCQALERFNRVIVRAGSEAFYDSTPSSSQAVLESLKQRGYTAESRPDTADADWPRHHLRLDRMAVECKRLKAELAEAKQAHQKAAQNLQEELARARQTHQKELEAGSKKFSAFQQSSDEREQQLQAALSKQKQELAEAEKSRDQAEERHRAELAEAQQAHEKAVDKLQEELKQFQAKLSAAENDAKATRQQNDDLQQKYRELEQEYQRKEALIDEEFLKAESQLELIKELVFRDKPV